MMDGAPINRSIIKTIQGTFGSFSSPNVNERAGQTITYIMDPKVRDCHLHVVIV